MRRLESLEEKQAGQDKSKIKNKNSKTATTQTIIPATTPAAQQQQQQQEQQQEPQPGRQEEEEEKRKNNNNNNDKKKKKKKKKNKKKKKKKNKNKKNKKNNSNGRTHHNSKHAYGSQQVCKTKILTAMTAVCRKDLQYCRLILAVRSQEDAKVLLQVFRLPCIQFWDRTDYPRVRAGCRVFCEGGK